MKYEVLSRIKYKKEYYAKGSIVDMPKEMAETLGKKILKPAPAAEKEKKQ